MDGLQLLGNKGEVKGVFGYGSGAIEKNIGCFIDLLNGRYLRSLRINSESSVDMACSVLPIS